MNESQVAVFVAIWIPLMVALSIFGKIRRVKRQNRTRQGVQQLAQQWQWTFNRELAADGLLSPHFDWSDVARASLGQSPEALADMNRKIERDLGAPYRTFTFLMQSAQGRFAVSAEGCGELEYDIQGNIQGHHCRIAEYHYTVEVGGDSDTESTRNHEYVTVLLLDLGQDAHLPWMKLQVSHLRYGIAEQSMGTAINLQMGNASRRMVSRNEQVARAIFGAPDMQHAVNGLPKLVSVELGSRWLFLQAKRMDATELPLLRDTALAVITAIPEQVLRYCSGPTAPITRDQYDSVLASQKLAAASNKQQGNGAEGPRFER